MKTATLTLVKVTEKFNGYGMPIVEVKSDIQISVINRGYNEFESIETINHSNIDSILNVIDKKHDTAMLEIELPSGKKTNSWFSLSEKKNWKQNDVVNKIRDLLIVVPLKK